MIYHIIGDVHGRMDKLQGLLTMLGYQHNGSYFQPPAGHQAIFVGDLIDRGGAQLPVLETVFAMIDNGVAQAVMGNHEYNALMYAQPHPTDTGYCRAHNSHNTSQHQAFLDEIPFDSHAHHYWLSRLYTLPLWLEMDDFCVVHATWDVHAMHTLEPFLTHTRQLTPSTLNAIMCQPRLFAAAESLLKGVECNLPSGIFYYDQHGQRRTRTRLNWWQHNLSHQPLRHVARLPNDIKASLPQHALTGDIDFYFDATKPIFIGHYWFDGTPNILANNVVCTDYSAATTGHLTAYCFNTEAPALSADNFVQYRGDA